MEAKDIMHPEDAKAIQAIKLLPGIDKMVQYFMEMGFEQQYRGSNLANMLEVNESNYPTIWKDFQQVIQMAGVEQPDLYIYNSPEMNAFTYGETNTFIALSSGLVEKLEREELQAVIGHECGHILCKHVLYETILRILKDIGFLLGILKHSLYLPIYSAMQYWSRKSELSADRCASVIAGEEVFQSVLLKLASGMKDAAGGTLVRQGREYESFRKSSIIRRIQQQIDIMFDSHPQLCIRAVEVDRWKKSYQYKQLLNINNRIRYGCVSKSSKENIR